MFALLPVSSLIRLPPYRAFKACAEFIANLMDYEPLTNPIACPTYLVSPATVLKWSCGDCFDLSNLLCSYLLGVGYDAYVVCGYAPRWVCLQDQSETECPLLVAEKGDKGGGVDKSKNNGGEDDSRERYRVKDRGVPESNFLKNQRLAEEAKALEQSKVDEYWDDDWEPEADPLEGQRVHAWVFIRAGKRDTNDHVFIEASTGRTFQLANSPYLGIESIWNHRNYYVNMQTDVKISETKFDLANPDIWEYVFLNSGAATDESAENGGGSVGKDENDDLANLEAGEDGDKDGHGGKDDENILDIPPSWVGKLNVSRESQKQKYFRNGQKTILYKRVKLELYAENVHEQGMVSRMTIFRDRAWTIPKETREVFANRRDKLEARTRYPLESKVHEFYGPGRVPEALKERIEVTGRSRTLLFYTSARTDGLERREEILGKKSTEFFVERDDHLVYRSVSVRQDNGSGPGKDMMGSVQGTNGSSGTQGMSSTSGASTIGGKSAYTLPGGQLGELVILKMTEKFRRNNSIPAEEDVSKRTYYLLEGKIRCIYHFAEGHITSASRTYYKQANVPTEVTLVDPYAVPPKDVILEIEKEHIMQCEKDCYTSVRHAELETQDILKSRKKEEGTVILDRSVFDTARESANDERQQDARVEEVDETDARRVDYLTAFLHQVVDPTNLTREEAQKARDNCLKALKDRLLERANIIQQRLDEENASLAKRQVCVHAECQSYHSGWNWIFLQLFVPFSQHPCVCVCVSCRSIVGCISEKSARPRPRRG